MIGATNIPRTGIMLFAMAGAMLGLGYASAPLYKLFCEATGFDGTTRRAEGDIAAGHALPEK